MIFLGSRTELIRIFIFNPIYSRYIFQLPLFMILLVIRATFYEWINMDYSINNEFLEVRRILQTRMAVPTVYYVYSTLYYI